MPEASNRTAGTAGQVIAIFTKISRTALIVRGILFIVFGLLVLANPNGFFKILTIAAGIVILLEGAVLLTAALNGPAGSGRILRIVLAVLVLLFGIAALTVPLQVDKLFAVVLGIWLAAGGIEGLAALSAAGRARTMAVVSSLIALAAGIVLIVLPFAGITAIGWIIGLLLIFAGAFQSAAGMAMKA